MNTRKFFALALCSAFAVSALTVSAACGTKGGSDEALLSRICYDNLPSDGISVPEAATRITVDGLTSYQEYTADGKEAASGTVATADGGDVSAEKFNYL